MPRSPGSRTFAASAGAKPSRRCIATSASATTSATPRSSTRTRKGGLEQLRSAGIRVPKLQLSAALRIAEVDAAKAERLRSFDEPVYLHQVVERRRGAAHPLPRPAAGVRGARRSRRLERARASGACISTCRSFWTRSSISRPPRTFLREILAIHRETPVSAHLEVETYTWDVLPEQDRQDDVATAIARELAWVRDRLSP